MYKKAYLFEDRILIKWPFRFKSEILLFTELKQVDFMPGAFRAQPAATFYHDNGKGKIIKHGFNFNRSNFPEIERLVKAANSKVNITMWGERIKK